MKKFLGMVVVGLVLGAAVLALGLKARADDHEGGPKGGVCPKGSPRYGETADRQDQRDGSGMMEGLKEKLDLSDEQINEMKSIRQKGREKSKTLHEKLKAEVRNLSEKLKAGADGAVLKSLLEKVYADQKILEAYRQKQMEETRNVMTPTQQAKWVVGMVENRRAGRDQFDKNDLDSKAKENTNESSSDEAQRVVE
jgi:Spy/CpxP family protein refolding chaperone